MIKIPLFTSVILLIFGFWTGFESGWILETGAPQLLVIGFVIFFSSLFFGTQSWDAEGMVEAIKKDKEKLLSGGEATYNIYTFNKNTELRRYQWAFSAVVLSTRGKSAYYVAPVAWWKSGFFTLFSLLFGWWGIPFGPFWTWEVIRNNLRGGQKFTVEDLIKYGDEEGVMAKSN